VTWTIADARAPGCEVSVRHHKDSFRAARQLDAHTMTSVAGGYAKLVSLEAKWGRQNTADIDIENTEVLIGDTRGACGELVIDKVFVGHGRRKLLASAEYSGSAGATVGPWTPSAATGAASKTVDELEWKNDQAYGFTYKENGKVEPLELSVFIPSVVTEGDDVEVRFESKQPAYLVVYYLDSEQKADVLWPSNEEPSPHVEPGNAIVLPSAREKSHGFHIKAALSKPGLRAREALVVYGFAEKGDFDRLKPSAGGSSGDGAAYASELTKKLESLPMKRWSRAVLNYVIEPKH
jgi:hypothetical protein